MALGELKEQALCLAEAIAQRLYRIPREVLVLDYKLMQIVTQEVRAHGAAVTVVYTEEGAFRPLLVLVVLRLRLHNVQDDGDAIFVVVANDALVRVSSVARHKTVPLVGELGVLVIRQTSRLAISAHRLWLLTHRDLVPDLIEVQVAATHAL